MVRITLFTASTWATVYNRNFADRHLITQKALLKMPNKDLFFKLMNVYGAHDPTGIIQTHIPGVRFFWSSEYVQKAPLPCSMGLVLLGQGHKIGYLDGSVFKYDADHYLISNVPVTYECETFASGASPVMGITIDIDIARHYPIIQKIKENVDMTCAEPSLSYAGIKPVKLSEEMQRATSKLLNCLQTKLDCSVLGEAAVDEVVYRALLGDLGNPIFAITDSTSNYCKIVTALNYIQNNYKSSLSVDELAKKANMSSSSFYRVFKQSTGYTPLQYIKNLRLHQARYLIVRDGFRISQAACMVGYESVSQFSREFKRYFSIPPSEAHTGAYSKMFNLKA